jgi:uncharacterized protein (TIGR02646 family)
MFGAKCCYCEAKVDAVSHRHVEHFRPQSIYPRLAYEWSNLLFACERCNSTHKRDQFPVGPSEVQAVANTADPCDPNEDDDALLIDPCRDDPAEHFEFAFDERVEDDYVDVVLICKTRRGEISRRVFGLNRPDLVDDWREHISGVQNAVIRYLLAGYSGNRQELLRSVTYLRKAMSPTNRYSAMTRAYITIERGLDI